MLIPENIYRATVVEADMGKAGTGIRQVAILFEVSRGPFEARRYTWYGFLNTRGNAKRSAAVMQTCGYDGRSLRSMLGKEVDIVIRHEEYREKTYARVAFVNAIATLALKDTLFEEEKQDVLGRLNLLLQELPLPAYSVDGEVPESDPKAGEDDALPF
jgi:hypothetical protein